MPGTMTIPTLPLSPFWKGFQDLYHVDFIHVVGCFSRRKLNKIKTSLYQKAMLLRSLSKNKDLEDPQPPALVQGMEYLMAVGVTILDVIADMNGNFQDGFKNTDATIQELGLKTDTIDQVVVDVDD